MKTEKLIIFSFRLIVLMLFIPLTLSTVLFSRMFERVLRLSLNHKSLNEVQRILNWKGITGIFELARIPK
ncbi:MAG: hypothetical protein EU536_04400 [Promethearchaeota archaeon]|nr:MAG: hypothetical protein EU536_04400 [Candidatus Lokiarchaeota archaeon]